MEACEALFIPGRRQLDFESVVGVGVGSACDDHESVLGSGTKNSVSILRDQALFGLRERKIRGEGGGGVLFRS